MSIEVTLSSGCFWYVRGEAAREGALTLANARAYVTAFHTELGCDRVEIEGCGYVSTDDADLIRLNVTTHHPEHGTDAVQWDVWEEMDGALYGEC